MAVEDDELLPEESILGNQLGSTACEVCSGAENNRVAGRLCEMQKGLLKRRNQTDEQLANQMKEGEYVVGLQESDQKPSQGRIPRSIGVKS